MHFAVYLQNRFVTVVASRQAEQLPETQGKRELALVLARPDKTVQDLPD